MSMVDPLARARGRGSAGQGTAHWLHQRTSALILLPLCGWLLYAIVQLAGADWASAREFVAAPLNTGAFVLFIISVLYHAMLGLQVVIEDYVSRPALELALQLLVKGAAYGAMIMGVVFTLRIALGA